jgi:hypothetical protein
MFRADLCRTSLAKAGNVGSPQSRVRLSRGERI